MLSRPPQDTPQDFQKTQSSPDSPEEELKLFPLPQDNKDTGGGLFSTISRGLDRVAGRSSTLTGYVVPNLPERQEPTVSEEAHEPSPLQIKLELAEEFRQIEDIDGARDLWEDVVAKNAEGVYGKLARARLEQLDDNSNTPLTLSEGQPDQPATPANPEISRLADAESSIEGGFLYRAPAELRSIIDNTESTAGDIFTAKTLLDQVELVLKTKEKFDRLVGMRQAPHNDDDQPSDQDIITAKISAITALGELYPYNGEAGGTYQMRHNHLVSSAAPYETPPAPPAPAAPPTAGGTDYTASVDDSSARPTLRGEEIADSLGTSPEARKMEALEAANNAFKKFKITTEKADREFKDLKQASGADLGDLTRRANPDIINDGLAALETI